MRNNLLFLNANYNRTKSINDLNIRYNQRELYRKAVVNTKIQANSALIYLASNTTKASLDIINSHKPNRQNPNKTAK